MVDPTDTTSRHPTADVAATVQDYLNDSPALTGNHIRCEMTGDRIVLRGYVSTYSMKHTARILAESISGDSRIEDRLDVIPIPPKWNQSANSNGQ